MGNLPLGEVVSVIDETGNHWRKIFSIMAKIANGLKVKESNHSWQEYRDQVLLTKKDFNKISFSKTVSSRSGIKIIVGEKSLPSFFKCIDHFSFVDDEGRIKYYKDIYLVPYLDYRQFPNQLIEVFLKHLNENNCSY